MTPPAPRVWRLRVRPASCCATPITIRKASDELDGLPGNVEADTVAHCGPSLKGEFCRTLTVVDFATGWTENASARNNAYRNLSQAEAMIEQRLPFTIRSYDNDNGSEFINTDFITHLQQLDIQQTRSRPYRKNDQATVESRNNHVVRKHAFYYRYELAELDLLNELWQLVSVKVNLFTPVQEKPVGRSSTRRTTPARLRPAHDPMGETQTIRRAGPGRRRQRVHPARATRPDRTSDRRDKPGRARPPHPRHPGPARGHGRSTNPTPRETRRPPTWHTWTGHSPRSRASDRKTTTKHQPTPTRISRSLPVRHHSRFRAHFQMRHLGESVPEFRTPSRFRELIWPSGEHLSPFQEAVHPSYPEYDGVTPNVIPPFSCCFYLGISISAVFFITLRDNLFALLVQMMLDAEVTAYPHERKQPYIN